MNIIRAIFVAPLVTRWPIVGWQTWQVCVVLGGIFVAVWLVTTAVGAIMAARARRDALRAADDEPRED